MSEESIRGEIYRRAAEIQRLEERQATSRAKSEKLRSEASRLRSSIRPSMSASLASSKLKQAERKEQDAAKEEKKVTDAGKQIVRKTGDLNSAQARLKREKERVGKKQASEEKRRQAQELAHAKKLSREREAGERRLRLTQLSHERRLTEEAQARLTMFSAAVDMQSLLKLPERITTLFVASDPRNEAQLDLANEVREVTQRIEQSKHRNSVNLVHAMAAQPADLIPALNKYDPVVLHFSGHGSAEGGLAFRDATGSTKMVDPQALAATIATGPDSVRLIVLNCCDSSEIASALVEHVDFAVGMADAIRDDSARWFSAALYGSIADGLSLRRAFDQACANLALEGVPDGYVPMLFSRSGANADETVLVRPPESFLDQDAA